MKSKMKFLYALMIVATFALGVGIGGLLSMPISQSTADVQSFSTSTRALAFNALRLADSTTEEPLKAVAQAPTFQGPSDKASPSLWVKESQIEMREDGVFIHINNPQWAILASTKSMDPVFDDTAHLIQEVPTSQDQIHVGDIVSYQSALGFTIVHRVIEIGNDENGWYAILKGDNNPTPDPWKVRWDMVRRVTVMVVY